MKRLLALLLMIGVSVGVVSAHNGMLHVMGTVTSITTSSITVKATDGTTQTVSFTSDTKYIKGMQAISALRSLASGGSTSPPSLASPWERSC